MPFWDQKSPAELVDLLIYIHYQQHIGLFPEVLVTRMKRDVAPSWP